VWQRYLVLAEVAIDSSNVTLPLSSMSWLDRHTNTLNSPGSARHCFVAAS